MKKSFILSFFMLCAAFSFADVKKSDFSLLGSGEVFALSPVKDGLLLGGGALLSGTVFSINTFCNVNSVEYEDELPKSDSKPFFDSLFMTSYSEGLDLTADYFRLGFLLAPVALFGFGLDRNEWFTVGVMYGETLLWTYGITELLKMCVDRARPYMYYDGAPKDGLEDGDWNNSFPSGHTSICFAAAAFSSYVFSKYNPDSFSKWAVTGVSFGLASTVGIMRMAAGCHFFTDVLTGAAIGTACGFVIPWLHSLKPESPKTRGLELDANPLGFTFTYRR